HVTPVARRIPDRQQHGHVPPARLGERLVPPLPPVDRVVRMLKQVRTCRAAQSFRHSPIFPPAGLRALATFTFAATARRRARPGEYDNLSAETALRLAMTNGLRYSSLLLPCEM